MPIQSQTLNDTLELLEMQANLSGIRFVDKIQDENDPYVFVVLEAAQHHGAKAVYFRFFTDGKPPRPQIFIFDQTDRMGIDQAKASEIHQNLWNAGIVPICLFVTPTEVIFFNCFESPFSKDQLSFRPLEILSLTNIVVQKFKNYSAKLFDSGLFWESEKGEKFDYKNSAYEQLLNQLKKVRKKLVQLYPAIAPSTLKRLLVMLILIKYLEDRKDENGDSALDPAVFYKDFAPDEISLAGVLRNRDACFRLFEKLSSKRYFNGQVFLFSPDETESLKTIDLELFAKFVEGDISFTQDKGSIGQMHLWKQYSFNYLPIELISHIYEDFLEDADGRKEKGVVYTPPALVQFLIDQTLPLNDAENSTPKILDPACGSGIFLVGVFKRLIQRWRVKREFKKPSISDIGQLQSLLSNAIYGCDIVPEAVHLTYFSLCLALLDALSPKEILGNVHFENLVGENLFANDFFTLVLEQKLPKDFDLIIGNPPFKSTLTEEATKVEKDANVKNKARVSVPDKQIALLFLEQSMKLLKPGGKTCLLLSSGPLIYNVNSLDFRNYLFSHWRLDRIYDFTALRSRLFKNAKPATLAAVMVNERPEDDPIYHILIRWTSASADKIEFETDFYDVHEVTQLEARENPRVWQTNFMGGGRLHELMDRLQKFPPLKHYLDEKEKTSGWKTGEGWIEAADSKQIKRILALEERSILTSEEQEELVKLKKSHEADYITGKPFVETDDFGLDGTSKIGTVDTRLFQWPRCGAKYGVPNRKIYEPPHLLIKKRAIGQHLPVLLTREYLTFKDDILGIYAPWNDFYLLERLEKFLKNPLWISVLWVFSGRNITIREGTILKDDLMSLPFSESMTEPSRNETYFLQDIKDHLIDFRMNGENSHVLKPIENPDDEILNEFGEIYCRILNSVYQDFHPAKPLVGSDFICYPFYCGDYPALDLEDNLEAMEIHLKEILRFQHSHNLWIRRILKVFEKNIIYLYKPNQVRYWLNSIAVKDADDTFSSLVDQGY